MLNLGRSALDVGGGGDCFFRAVSHQLYGNANNHFFVRTAGVQYIVHNPEKFIESNTEHSWQGYSLNLSIHIAKSNPGFSPVFIVQQINVTGGLNIYIGHIDEIHYVSTVQNKTLEITDNSKYAQNIDEHSPADNSEKRKAYKRNYMRKYMKKRRADENLKKKRE